MKYQKPQLVRLAAAIKAVQNPMNKEIYQQLDGSSLASATAYAADE
jgi:hypothetical protein